MRRDEEQDMRITIPLTIAATLLIAAPAAAQDNAVTTANEVAVPEAGTADPLDANATMTADPANGMAADPMAAPVAADPAATDPAYAEPAADDDGDDGRFPWGLLGLLGLAGLIPRKPAPRRHDGAI
jgi:MYXO-CTERM domain-containing protein